MHARVLACSLWVALAAVPCSAQLPPASIPWMDSPIARADALYFSGEAEAAFELLREHLAGRPDDYDALWRVVRSTVVLGVAAEGWQRQNSWLDTGMDFGERAVESRPDGVDGRYWRGAVTGRRAQNAAAEYGAELAQRAYEDAHAILAVEPEHGGAHNILGKIFFEVMSMSRLERWVGRTFMRTDVLEESSWEAAELHLAAAAAGWPESVLVQYDLAELFRKRGREDEARLAYERVTHMPVVHPTDPDLQRDAERILEELGG